MKAYITRHNNIGPNSPPNHTVRVLIPSLWLSRFDERSGLTVQGLLLAPSFGVPSVVSPDHHVIEFTYENDTIADAKMLEIAGELDNANKATAQEALGTIVVNLGAYKGEPEEAVQDLPLVDVTGRFVNPQIPSFAKR